MKKIDLLEEKLRIAEKKKDVDKKSPRKCNFMNRLIKKEDLLAILFILIFCFVFFNRFFKQDPMILYTVEPIGSDIWNFNYPEKVFLSRSLKDGVLPFWSKNMGSYPLFAEGQVGSLYLPNLILYYLLPTWLAWNLNYLLVFFLSAFGTFLFARRLKVSNSSSLLCSIIYAFGGYFISRMVHTSPLQVMSLMPWFFLLSERLWDKVTIFRILAFSFVLCQQILAGHPQWVFITFVGYGIYRFVKTLITGERFTLKLTAYILGIIIALGLSSIQLIPAIEYFKESVRSGAGLSENIFSSDNSILNLYRFINPSYFGFNKYGVKKVVTDAGLTWEEERYIGILPLLFLIIFLIRKKDVTGISLGVLFVISLLLVLGKSSPLCFIYQIFPFSYFKIPSRYLILTTFSICIIAARSLDFVLEKIKVLYGKKVTLILFTVIFVVALFDIVRFGYNYHSLTLVKEAESRPEILSFLKPGSRVYTPYSNIDEWKRAYSKYGYGGSSVFLYFKNFLFPSIGEIWNVTTVFNANTFKPLRELDYSLVNDTVLDIYSVDYVISTSPIEGENYENVGIISPKKSDLPEIKIYKNNDKLDRFRISNNFKVVSSIEEIKKIYRKGIIDKEVTIIEEDISGLPKKNELWSINVFEDENTTLRLNVETKEEGLLVIADSYYPGWKAYVNSNKTRVIPSNLNQRGIIVPQGKSNVALKYEPGSFKWGVRISVGTLLLTLLVISGLIIRIKISKVSRDKYTISRNFD